MATTVLLVVLVLYFLAVCIHLNAAGLSGVVMGIFGLYSVYIGNYTWVSYALSAVIGFHLLVKGTITKAWEIKRHKQYSIFHIVVAGVLLALVYVYHVDYPW